VQLGDLATWLAAAGTIGALWFTAITVRRDRDERRSEDARKVSAWISASDVEVSVELPPAQGLAEPHMTQRIELNARNGGPEPIYYIRIRWRNPSGRATGSLNFLAMAPGETRISELKDPRAAAAYVEMDFRDPAGRMWSRDSQGRLILRKERAPIVPRNENATP
jgi:hypothetical protein